MARPTTAVAGRPDHADPGEAALVEALRAGDERAFVELVRRHHAPMLRVALNYVSTRAVAEEVVQETWLAALNGLDRFESRSSVKTWLFRILINRAKTRGVRESRIVPMSSVRPDGEEESEWSVDPSRFIDGDHRWHGHWTAPPQDWRKLPDERLMTRETITRVQAAIDTLPARQREVIVLRDVEGCSSEECCAVLGLSEANQRVLLHRARSKVRRALEEYMDGADAS